MKSSSVASLISQSVLCIETNKNTFVINISRNKIIYSSHHLSHCLYGSSVVKNISEYVYVTCDGVGEGETMSIYTIDNEYKIEKIWTNFYPHSIGLFYSTITDYLGFEINEGEFEY